MGSLEWSAVVGGVTAGVKICSGLHLDYEQIGRSSSCEISDGAVIQRHPMLENH